VIVGVVKETKEYEYRVAMVPSGVTALHKRGHTVVVQRGAGAGSSCMPDKLCAPLRCWADAPPARSKDASAASAAGSIPLG